MARLRLGGQCCVRQEKNIPVLCSPQVHFVLGRCVSVFVPSAPQDNGTKPENRTSFPGRIHTACDVPENAPYGTAEHHPCAKRPRNRHIDKTTNLPPPYRPAVSAWGGCETAVCPRGCFIARRKYRTAHTTRLGDWRTYLLAQLAAHGGVELVEEALPALVARARLSKVVHPLILRIVVHDQLVHQSHHLGGLRGGFETGRKRTPPETWINRQDMRRRKGLSRDKGHSRQATQEITRRIGGVACDSANQTKRPSTPAHTHTLTHENALRLTDTARSAKSWTSHKGPTFLDDVELWVERGHPEELHPCRGLPEGVLVSDKPHL